MENTFPTSLSTTQICVHCALTLEEGTLKRGGHPISSPPDWLGVGIVNLNERVDTPAFVNFKVAQGLQRSSRTDEIASYNTQHGTCLVYIFKINSYK